MAADVYAAIQDASGANGLIIVPRELKRRIVQKILEVTFALDVWGEHNEYILNWSVVTGACRFEFKSGSTDDKAMNKCLTACMKSALVTAFKIASDDARVERAFDGDPDEQPNSDPDDPPRDDRRPPDRNRDDEPRDDRTRDDRGSDDRGRDDRTRDYRDDPPRDDRRPPRDEPPRDAPRDPPRETRTSRGERVDSDGVVYGPPRDDPPPPEDDRRPSTARADEASDLRGRVMAFSRKLRAATTAKEAQSIWALDGRDVIEEMSDATYDFLRTEFQDRWNEWPA
jgi:hypothetical protein